MSITQYYAKLDDNNIVIDIAVTTKLFMQENPDRYIGKWVETFFDLPTKTYAGIGYLYNEKTKDFTELVAPIVL